jgi:plastocyanin
MKKVSILSLALFSFILLSSCGGGSSPTGSSYNNESSGGTNDGNNSGGSGTTNIAVSASSGKYIINGITTGSLSLEKGMTYTFTNSSSSAHPFRLSQTADGTHSGGSSYSLGVSYSGNVLTFVVPSTAPATLYYFCTVHSGMGGSGSIAISGTSGGNNGGGNNGGESGGSTY